MSNLYNFIVMPNDFESFDFNLLKLESPISLQNNNYFTKITNNNNPLVIQTLKSKTKQGIIKTGKKWLCDLVFDNTSEKIIDWFSNLENKCKELLFEKNNIWFQTPLTLNDIDDTFINIVKVFKSGKQYIVRTNIKSSLENDIPLIKIYNESHTPLNYDYLTNDMFINCLIEIKGIKFSLKNFQIDIEIKHILVLEEDKYLQDIYISKNGDILNKSKDTNIINTDIVDKIQLNSKTNNNFVSFKDNNINEYIKEINNNEQEINKEEKENINDNEQLINNNNDEEKEKINDEEINNNEEEKEEINKINDEEINDNKEEINDEEIKNNVFEDDDIKELSEYDLEVNLNKNDFVKLKNKKEYYKDLYLVAKNKAKEAKKNAILAYLEAKEIKNTYMIEGDNSDFDNEIDSIKEEDLNF